MKGLTSGRGRCLCCLAQVSYLSPNTVLISLGRSPPSAATSKGRRGASGRGFERRPERPLPDATGKAEGGAASRCGPSAAAEGNTKELDGAARPGAAAASS